MGSSPAPKTLALRRQQAETVLVLARIHQAFLRQVGTRFSEEGFADITPTQANVLMVLFQARTPLTARHLARQMLVTEVTMGRFVKKLQESGWVEREPHPKDSRALLVRLTAKARDALPRFVKLSNEMLDRAFTGMDPPALEDFMQRLAELQSNLTNE